MKFKQFLFAFLALVFSISCLGFVPAYASDSSSLSFSNAYSTLVPWQSHFGMTVSNFSTTFGTVYTPITSGGPSYFPRDIPGSSPSYSFINSTSGPNPNTLSFRYYSADNSEVPSSLVYRLFSDPVPPNSSFAFVVSGFTSYLQSIGATSSIQATYRYTIVGPSGGGGGTTTDTFSYDYSPRPVSNPFTKCPYKAYFTDDPDNPISVGFQYATKPLVISGFNSSPSSRVINIDFVLDTSDSLYTFRLPTPDPTAYPNAHLTGVRSYLYPVLYYTQNSSSWLPESLQRSLHDSSAGQVSFRNSTYLITSPGQNSIPDIPSDPGPDPGPDPSPGGNQDVVDSITDQTNQQKSFFDSILSFFNDFFGNLAKLILGLFVPLDSEGNPDFGSLFDDLSDSLKSKLGFLTEVIELIDTFFGSLFDSTPDSTFLYEFPGISFRLPVSGPQGGGAINYTIVPPGTIDFSSEDFTWTPEGGSPVSFNNSYFTFVRENLLSPIALIVVCFAIIRTFQEMYDVIIEDPFEERLAVREG